MDWFEEFRCFTDTANLPQRAKMCGNCPSRIVSASRSVESHLKFLSQKKHRCHEAYNTICAGALARTTEGLNMLVHQFYEGLL